MTEELNKKLTISSSPKKVSSNNILDDDNNKDIYYFKENEEENINNFNLNKNSQNPSLNNENKIGVDNLQNNNFIDLDDKKLYQINNDEFLIQQLMANNNEKSFDFSIQNENFCLENNNLNTSKERKLSNNSNNNSSSYINDYNKKRNENKMLNKKKGRKKLNEISNSIRNKFAKDNINKKIKRYFLQNFLATLIQTICDSKKIFTIKIKKFNNEIVSQTNIGFNIELFNLTLRELLKTKISKKYKIIQTRPNEKVCSPNENEKILNLIEQINDFKSLLDMKLKEIYKIFIKNKEEFEIIMKSKFNIDFKNNFEYYVNLEKDQKYREKILYYGNNYEKEYLNENDARKLRKRKNLINN